MSRLIIIPEQTVKVFTFNELSQEAQNNAYESSLEGNEYPWYKENEDSLKAFCDYFYIANYNHNEYSISFQFNTDEDIKHLKGVRLATYIYNNYIKDLYKGKYISKHCPGKSRHSKCQVEISCPWTGYCMDDILLSNILKFIERPRDNSVTFDELIQYCLDEWLETVNMDIEDYYSYERFLEYETEGSDNEYTENGELY